ncbi:ExbD/TolR family protein [Billgrantia endophytica]|uniref:Biopolymer transporter ExbD n=1 Tax=Billgrantia endophytica TaxID=2033802 RepID=A0A2N7UEF4_9GAMM|nr:biopolymer transporter ExbD [Halomonas endophytica]PMR78813.1 biopolymer transporter ExbD [Halomonas endophytica]
MDEKPFESMNVIPLVDIMLVLLVIVLTTSSFIATGRIPIDLPQVSDSVAEEAHQAQLIELDMAGEIHFNGTPSTAESLAVELETFDRETPFLVRADREIALQSFIDVVDLLKRLDFTQVAVQTETRH